MAELRGADVYYSPQLVSDGHPMHLNENGDVTINRYGSVDTFAPVIYSGELLYEVGDETYWLTHIEAMNSYSIAAGSVMSAFDWQAAVYQDFEWMIIPDLESYEWSKAIAITDSGIVLGNCFDGMTTYSFTYDVVGLSTTVSAYGGFVAADINEEGTIVFQAYVQAIQVAGTMSWMFGFPMGSSVATPIAINNPRQVLCAYEVYTVPKAGVWNNGTVVTLPTFDGGSAWPVDINDDGKIVGFSSDMTDGICPALWEPDGMGGWTISKIKIPGMAVLSNLVKISNDVDGYPIILAEGGHHPQVYLLEHCSPPGMGADTTPPIISMFYILSGPYFRAYVYDNVAIDWDTLRIYVDGWYAPGVASSGQIYCLFDHDLPSGNHYIEIYICDMEGNETCYYTTFSYGGSDMTPPVISDMAPAGNAATGWPLITARVDDYLSWINWAACEAMIDSVPVHVKLSTTYRPNGIVTIIPNGELSAGAHAIELTVYNGIGMSAYEMWYVTVDSTLTVSDPYPTIWINDPLAPMGAHLTATGMLLWNYIHVYVDGVEVDYEYDGAGNEWDITVTPDPQNSQTWWDDGVHTVSVAGVSWAFGVSTMPPTLDATDPANAAMVKEIPTIRAYVTASGLDYINSTAEIDGVPITFEDIISGYYDSGLSEDLHLVTLHLVDENGHFTDTYFWFVLDMTPPAFDTISPADNSTVLIDAPMVFTTFSDELSGIDFGNVTATLADSSVVALPVFGTIEEAYTYFFSWGLSAGSNTVTITITDLAGNDTQFVLDLTYAAPSGLIVTLSTQDDEDELPQTWVADVTDTNHNPIDPGTCTFIWSGCPGTANGDSFTISAGSVTGDFTLSIHVTHGMATGYADIHKKLVPGPYEQPEPGAEPGPPPTAQGAQAGSGELRGQWQ